MDFELTLSMPERLTADTGTDSLTHAIESYVSRKANGFTDALALTAMQTIWRVLPVCVHEPGNREAREAMMLAATQAGMAFSNASVGLVHGMSRPLGAHFHIPHGLSNAMLLPAVTEFSASAAIERYANCARTMGIAEVEETAEKAVNLLIRALYRRNAELEVPTPKQFGIQEEQYFAKIPLMAEQALASGSPQNNPRVPTAERSRHLSGVLGWPRVVLKWKRWDWARRSWWAVLQSRILFRTKELHDSFFWDSFGGFVLRALSYCCWSWWDPLRERCRRVRRSDGRRSARTRGMRSSRGLWVRTFCRRRRSTSWKCGRRIHTIRRRSIVNWDGPKQLKTSRSVLTTVSE